MKLPNVAIRRVVDDLQKAELGDLRRNRRLGRVASNLAKRPNASIPEIMGSEAELEGAYRLVNNPRVTMDALHEAHAKETAARASKVGRVLAIHDTTPCQFLHANPDIIGYLNTGKPGFYCHYTLVVDADSQRPLGVSHIDTVIRTSPPRKRKRGSARKRPSGAQTRTKRNREFERWHNGIEQTEARLGHSEVIHIADRESDSYELIANAFDARRRIVFRARILNRNAQSSSGDIGALHELAAQQEGVLTREVALSSRKAGAAPSRARAHPPRRARVATLSYSAAQIEVRRPNYLGRDFPKSLTLNVVRVWEPKPPTGEEPVEWLLLTTEPIDTPSQIAEVVDIYRARWLIEECNKALKTGCLYEQRQFESRDALLTILALSLPIACEILALRAGVRQNPDRPARDVLSPLQIRILRALGSRKLPDDPTARDVLLAVAALGGHQRSNGEPGWLVLRRGMSRLLDYEKGWRASRALEDL